MKEIKKSRFDIIEEPILLSLFDYSGQWSKPYREAGNRVVQIDTKLGFDILTWDYKQIRKNLVKGILAAPPCTDFTVSGAQYWKRKDEDGTTAFSLLLVKKTIEIIEYFNPDMWALENPVGRLNTLLPQLKKFGPFYWQPWHYGDPYTKKTGLWGKFNLPYKKTVEPKFVVGKNGDKYSEIHWFTGGKSERTKEIRSNTPMGFAYAFYEANKFKLNPKDIE